ncbi:hypothetical protein [Lactococcus termiticola]|uniref:Metal-dependent hydrolase n=1 Tax=Lactococcus termiticola TaxID=2169526 RepID=A0A2R5HDD0_9LACT|nr:hypothetical protein [Lactococcus termiticola]GBG96094.1 hypothetical protein NtB2_00198 [Lactococcus termiticola]
MNLTLLLASKVLIGGDAVNVQNGELIGSNPAMTWNMEQAEASLEKVKQLDLSGVIAYHTGFLKY